MKVNSTSTGKSVDLNHSLWQSVFIHKILNVDSERSFLNEFISSCGLGGKLSTNWKVGWTNLWLLASACWTVGQNTELPSCSWCIYVSVCDWVNDPFSLKKIKLHVNCAACKELSVPTCPFMSGQNVQLGGRAQSALGTHSHGFLSLLQINQ